MEENAGDPPSLAITALMLTGEQKTPLQDSANSPSWTPGDGVRWLDVVPPAGAPTAGEIHSWSKTLGLPSMVTVMAADLDHHPRLVRHGTGVILSLREAISGTDQINQEPTPFNLWCDGDQLITIHRRPVLLLTALTDAIKAEQGPQGAADGLVWLAERLVGNLRLVLSDVDRQLDALEACLHDQDFQGISQQLVRLRGQLSRLLLFHVQPQLRTLRTLAGLPLSWLDSGDSRHLLKESVTRTSLLLRELTHMNQRLEHLQESFANILDHRLNARVYTLTMITGVFFPMVFLTGLLGVNLGGIPGSSNPWAFTIFCLFLILLGSAFAWWFHRHKWL